MKQRTFVQKIAPDIGNPNARHRECSHLVFDRGILYSYGKHYPLLFKIGNVIFRNVAGYSQTTNGKHIPATYNVDAYNVKLKREFSLPYEYSYGGNTPNQDDVIASLEHERDTLLSTMDSLKRKDTKKYLFLQRQLANVDETLSIVKPC